MPPPSRSTHAGALQPKVATQGSTLPLRQDLQPMTAAVPRGSPPLPREAEVRGVRARGCEASPGTSSAALIFKA